MSQDQQQPSENLSNWDDLAWQQDQLPNDLAWQQDQLQPNEPYDFYNQDFWQKETPPSLFSDENPYLEAELPFDLAMEFLNKGQTNNGMLALEAYLKKNDQDSKAWRILGDLHMECDNDEFALECLKNALKIDPNDLDTLLGLVVSCANQLDKGEALNYLKTWLVNNPKYSDYVTKNELLSKIAYEKIDVNSDSNAIKAEIVKVLEAARTLNPQDTDLIMCLAVHQVNEQAYEDALELFKEAAKTDPQNYSFWNKVGAVASFLQRKEECIQAYTEALTIKPNYVRAWMNMGIIHCNSQEHANTIKYYLTALSLRPKLEHVWNYLQIALLPLNKFDLITAVNKRDVKPIAEEFPFVSADELPEPKIEYKKLNEKYLIRTKIED